MHVALGKKPVFVRKDVPGMLANRLQEAILREAFSLVENGVATAEDIDRTMQYGPGFRYPLAGPIRIVDFGGSDIWCVEAANLLPDMDELAAELSRWLPEGTVPELVHVCDYHERVLVGEYALCVNALRRAEAGE